MERGETTPLPQAIQASIEAHGGAARWNRLTAIDATVSAQGFLFAAKGRPVLRRVRVSAWTREVRFVFHDFPRAGETSELLGHDEVRVVASDGSVLARRMHPRSAFGDWHRMFRWDHLDFVYFGGYATWNYLTAPFVFLREGFTFEERPGLATPAGRWSRIRVTFPESIPTHSRSQDFYFDERGRLCRLDYTAEVVGSRARAAHTCTDFQVFDGLLVPTHRIVKPLAFGDTPLPFPTLVALRIEAVRPRETI
jgi:hypothetical protein